MAELKYILAVYDDHCQIREVYKDGNLSSPSLLTEKTLKDIFIFLKEKEFGPEYVFKDIIPNNVLHFDSVTGDIVWYTEPSQQYLLLPSGMKEGLYPNPYLLWIFKGSTLTLFALKEKPKSLKDKVYQAPYLNTGSSGNVCMGNVKINKRKNYFDDVMKDVENGFWNSKFTHTNTNNLIKGGIQNFYESYLGKKEFPNDLLIDKSQTIKQCIS